MNTSMRQNSSNLVFNQHVVVSNMCRFLKLADLKSLRLFNHTCNYAALLFMKQHGRRPTVHLRTDGDISAFLTVMSQRTNQELPGFCRYNLALASTSLQQVEQFVSSSSHLLEFTFHYMDLGSAEHLPPEVLDEQIASGQFCSKMLAVLKNGSAQLQKITIRSIRDISVEEAMLEEFPATFGNLRKIKAHNFSHGFQLTGDFVSMIVSRAPKLESLEVVNFFSNILWNYNALFLPRLVQILNRPNPPFLTLRTRLMLQNDIDSLETLVRVYKYNRLKLFQVVLKVENEDQANGGELLKRFSKFLKFQAPSLQELYIVAIGDIIDIVQPLHLPELPNLKRLELCSISRLRQSVVKCLTPNQFPNLETLIISGQNSYKAFVGENVLPSVKLLRLGFGDSNFNSRVEDAASTSTIHINFPNLKKLELHDSAFMNLKRVDYVLNYLVNLEVLVLNTCLSLKHRGGNAFWKTFAGKHFRLAKPAILKLCQRRSREPIVKEERETERNTSRPLPSLGNLRRLKILKISVSLATQLGALAYMARPECMHPLQQLHLSFTPGNSIDPDDQDDFVRMLRRFHKEVILEEPFRCRQFVI